MCVYLYICLFDVHVHVQIHIIWLCCCRIQILLLTRMMGVLQLMIQVGMTLTVVQVEVKKRSAIFLKKTLELKICFAFYIVAHWASIFRSLEKRRPKRTLRLPRHLPRRNLEKGLTMVQRRKSRKRRRIQMHQRGQYLVSCSSLRWKERLFTRETFPSPTVVGYLPS